MSAGDGKGLDRKLSSLNRFASRGRAVPNTSAATKKPNIPGAAPKRTFSPNIVSRNLKKEEVLDKDHPEFKTKRGTRGRPRGRGGRGRGDNLIQSAGVFSHGFSQPTLAKALGGGGDFVGRGWGGGGGGGGAPSSKFSVKAEDDDGPYVESGKVEEAMEEDGKLDPELIKDGHLQPITLPLGSKNPPPLQRGNVKIKTETRKKVDTTKPDVKMLNRTASKESTPQVADLFQNEANDGQLLFFQFPDTLPIKPISEEVQVKIEEGNETNPSVAEDLSEQLKRFTFKNVSEGFIGKLCVHKSGKVKMHLGNVCLDVNLGTPCGFLQDLVSIRTDKTPEEMISLGHVNHRLIAIPDYKELLGSVTR